MAEDGQASAATAVSENATIVAAELHADDHPHGANANKQAPDGADVKAEDADGPLSPRLNAPLPFGRNHTKVLSLDDYFVGPRDTRSFSKWPTFLQMSGSIMPKMVFPLLLVGGWATCITCVSALTQKNLGISSTLLTVTGFVVGLGLSFRSSTGYERYSEGRRYWAQLVLACQSLGRVFWIHANEREGELGKKDVLAKLTALNLLTAFAVSLKHKLRFEPYTEYEDLASLIAHLDTFAQAATHDEPDLVARAGRPQGFFKATGNYLGLSFAASNPRKVLKRARRPLGNLPLEILTYLAAFTDELVGSGQLPIPMTQTLAYNNIASLNDVLTGTERVESTPLPVAYTIAIGQITWLYVVLLPFQLYGALGWITIPATVAAAYIILGILFIGREVENPFGNDPNDLPLESFCAQVAAELDVLASRPKPRARDWVESERNRPLWPLSRSSYGAWLARPEERVREAVVFKTELGCGAGAQTVGASASASGGGSTAASSLRKRDAKVEVSHV